jgi:lipid II:glycine glycyltransferase (peptidoglycan interpeptide bridge formation enzyme)
MEVKKIEEKEKWNRFLLAQPSQAGIFLQSWEWLDFQQEVKERVWRLGLEDNHQLKGVCGVIKYLLLGKKNYLYIPRGPIVDNKEEENYSLFFETIKMIAQEEKSIFLRIEPLRNLTLPNGQLKIVKSVQPKQTLLLDLSLSEEGLLSQMHEKTRYNIRLARRKGVEVRLINLNAKDEFEKFWDLLKKTAERNKFKLHPKEYYQKMLEILGKEDFGQERREEMRVRLYLAYYQDKPIAGAIVGYFGETATYLHGASSYQDRALMAPCLLHWEIIRQAKKEGYKFYDFWGIDEKRWPGLTRFKKGFGGQEVIYPGAFELPFSCFWYKVYWLGKKFFSLSPFSILPS